MDESDEERGLIRPLPAFDDLRAITNAVPTLISFYDSQHVCRFANDFHEEWYGLKPTEVVGRHMREMIGEERYALRQAYLARVAAGRTASFDTEVRYRDGEMRPAAIRYVPKMGVAGFEGFYVLVFDTSRQQRRFRSVYDATAVAFWELDFSGVADMLRVLKESGNTDIASHIRSQPDFMRRAMEATRVIDVNAKAVELFGASNRSEMTGNVSRFWPRSSEPVFGGAVFAAIGGKQRHYEAETVLARVDGSEFDALFTCTFPDPKVGGPAPNIVVAVVDISARVKAQDALAKVQAELAHAVRVATLGELTASIAHEVNQPLAAIVTNGDAALRWLRRPSPDLAETGAAIERMIAEGKRASEVIARIRAMATKGTTDFRRLCPNLVTEGAVAVVRRDLSAQGVALAMRLTAAPPAIVGDRVQLQQVLINLMVNAAQAMTQQRDRPRTITVSTSRAAEAIQFDVSDTGPGIAPENAGQLFSAFYSTKPAGMGLGLSIAKSIVEGHGGNITVMAAEPSGATFRFTIPLATAEA
ncbi:MAG: PAS domain S-box protein [Enhydrobacter sp.]|nr:PAS domain S-box protein [Enhydrobacter sp.]